MSSVDSMLAFCESERDWLLDTLETLVRSESPSTDKAAVDRCGTALARRLADMGGRVHQFRQERYGDQVRAEFGTGERRVLLLGHFDTVWPAGQLQRMPFVEREGRLHGPGVFDMKSGIAVAMLAVRALHARHGRDLVSLPRIVMLWTADEEIGSPTSRPIIEEEAQRSDVVLVLEPSLPGGAAKTSRKGCGEFELIVHGVSAHAGLDPGKGVSAIHELARQVLAIEALQDLQRGVSVNVGVVSGGSRPNVIAGEARATIDVRVPGTEDARRIGTALAGLKPHLDGARLEVTGGFDRPPLERTPAVARLYEEARAAAALLGRDLHEGSAGGGSDGNFTGALGVPTLDGLGPCGDGAHALHEHVLASDLVWRAAWLAMFLTRLPGVK